MTGFFIAPSSKRGSKIKYNGDVGAIQSIGLLESLKKSSKKSRDPLSLKLKLSLSCLERMG